jgi:hypothetical protein
MTVGENFSIEDDSAGNLCLEDQGDLLIPEEYTLVGWLKKFEHLRRKMAGRERYREGEGNDRFHLKALRKSIANSVMGTTPA